MQRPFRTIELGFEISRKQTFVDKVTLKIVVRDLFVINPQHIACSRSTYQKSTPGQKMHILGADISSRDVYFLLAGAGSCAALSYVAYKFLAPPESLAINQEFIRRTVGKGKEKVTNVMDLEEIGNEAWFCRCWQSKKFPFCDGTHSQMKLVTGPLGIKRRSAAPEDKQ